MIAIIDYGAGNLASVFKAIRHLGHECVVTMDPAVVQLAGKLVIPGVGNFKATQPLVDGALGGAVRWSIRAGKPLLGICLGLQWLFTGSTECPELPGLGAFAGNCERFSANVKSPHVGWNRIEVKQGSRLLRSVANGSYVYFTHSYRPPLCSDTVGVSLYEVPFTAAVERDNLFGVQFHPEKSGNIGLGILENFCALPHVDGSQKLMEQFRAL